MSTGPPAVGPMDTGCLFEMTMLFSPASEQALSVGPPPLRQAPAGVDTRKRHSVDGRL